MQLVHLPLSAKGSATPPPAAHSAPAEISDVSADMSVNRKGIPSDPRYSTEVLPKGIKDTQGGAKSIPREMARRLLDREGALPDVELHEIIC
jgi:hypothetical protein